MSKDLTLTVKLNAQHENNNNNDTNADNADNALVPYNSNDSVLDIVHTYRRTVLSRPCSTTNCSVCPFMLNTTSLNNNDGEWTTCNAECAVYLIICKKCKKQYVGETSRSVRRRVGEHLNEIRNDNRTNTFLLKHFNNGICKRRHFRFTILHENIANSVVRRSLESNIIKSHQTMHPMGLNQRFSSTVKDDKPRMIQSIQLTFGNEKMIIEIKK